MGKPMLTNVNTEMGDNREQVAKNLARES